jgi:hypothetical protein
MAMKEFKFFKQNNLPKFTSPGLNIQTNNITQNTYYFNVADTGIFQIETPLITFNRRVGGPPYLWDPVKITFIDTIPVEIMENIIYSINNNIIDILVYNGQILIETWQLHGCTITELHIHQTSEITLDPQNVTLI